MAGGAPIVGGTKTAKATLSGLSPDHMSPPNLKQLNKKRHAMVKTRHVTVDEAPPAPVARGRVPLKWPAYVPLGGDDIDYDDTEPDLGHLDLYRCLLVLY